jgi:hypothetical protein
MPKSREAIGHPTLRAVFRVDILGNGYDMDFGNVELSVIHSLNLF